MVDAEAQTDAPTPAVVVGVQQDLLMGVRVRKNFGARIFWGTVVGCYWVSGGLFYKVSFDDGDVDIFSADEVVQDAQQAKKYPQENPQMQKDPSSSAVDEYFLAMRHYHLKRKRDEPVDTSVPNVRRVQLWGQRLYASIFTNDKNETFVKELIKTDDGQAGEMEVSGHVQVGDMILAVNNTRVLGMDSKSLADLIRRPKRPITLTFYRPQRAQLPPEQQQALAEQTTAPAATSAAEQTQTQTSTAPRTQSAASGAQTQMPTAVSAAAPAPAPAPAAAPAPVVPSSFAAPQLAFAQPASMAQGLSRSWTQTTHTPQRVLNRDLLRQRLIQSVAARQPGYVGGFPMTSAYAPGVHGVPASQSFAYLSNQHMHRMVDAAAIQLHAPAGRPVRPMTHLQPSAQANRVEYNTGRNQRRRTEFEQCQEMISAQRTARELGGFSSQQPPTQRTSSPQTQFSLRTAQDSRFSIISQDKPNRTTGPSQPRNQQHIPSPRQISNKNPTSDWSSGGKTLHENSLASSVDADAEAIAALAEKDPAVAANVMSTSFLSPQTNSNSTATSAPTSADSMSFLSPNDFKQEPKVPSPRDHSVESAKSTPSPVKSNVSLVTVRVHRQRLYLTLGVQGTLIAVTSFVRDENGQPGEVEASSQVFLGDVLVRINDTFIVPGMTPGYVAEIVTSTRRPMTLWFERASWDILNGKE